MDQSQARGVVRTLFGFFPNVKMSDDIVEAWAEQIVTEDQTDANAAAHQLARDSQYRPSLAQFLAAIWSTKRDRDSTRRAPQHYVDYSHHIGVRAPCDDEMSPTAWGQAVIQRGGMVGK